MDANRARIALVLPCFLAISGCQLFQPTSSKTDDKPAEIKKKEPAEVVAKPAARVGQGASREDEASSAIVQWAQSAAKAREQGAQTKPPIRPPNLPDQFQSSPEIAAHSPATDSVPEADSGAAPVFEATIPVELAGESAGAPRVPAPNRAREIVARRDKPPTLTNAPVQPDAALVSSTPTERRNGAAPPKVGAITARPVGGTPAKRTSSTEKSTVTLNNPESAGGGEESLKDLLDDALAQPGDASFREQLDRKMLLVMKGDYEKAREPFVLASPAQQEMGRRLLESLIAVRDGHGGDPSGAAADVLAQVGKLRDSLVMVSDLSLPTFSICRAVRGFGQYDPIEPAKFVAGRENQFVAYCEIRDFASEQRDDGFASNFSMKVAILDRTGDEVHQLSTDDIVDKCRTRRSDCFLSPVVRLPATLSPGEYVARITIQDKIGKKAAEKVATFRVVAK